jgi:DNA modification methylase
VSVTLHEGDCLAVMARMKTEGVLVDAIVTDPPYHLTSIVKRFGGKNAAAAQHGTDGLYARASAGFMGKQWDGGDIAFRAETWALALDLLKPGGHILAFSGTRTYHRMAVAIEDAGFVIRDQFAWVYGSGFPKSHDISKAIDKAAGAEREVIGKSARHVSGKPKQRTAGLCGSTTFAETIGMGACLTAPATDEATQWEGWGTAVKPAWEPICLAQKPVEGTIAGNVLKHGVGGLNIDGCRIHTEGSEGKPYTVKRLKPGATLERTGGNWQPEDGEGYHGQTKDGRFPANLTHDGSADVLACFPHSDSKMGGSSPDSGHWGNSGSCEGVRRDDSGSAARFFYTAKADENDRWGSKHPTVKPIDLIRYYARLITPPGGLILDPFAGSGTLGVAAMAEGFSAVLIEREAEYVADIRERIAFYEGQGRHSLASKNRNAVPPKSGENPLIDWLESQAEAAE